MFRLLWFIIGLLIGSWITRPVREESSPSMTPSRRLSESRPLSSEVRTFRRAAEDEDDETDEEDAEDETADDIQAPLNTDDIDEDEVIENLEQSAQVSDSAKTKEVPALEDNLIDIKGIGPVFVTRLHELNILTFAQLADETPASLAEKMGGTVSAERIEREQWIEQARTMAGR